ncbi:tRNA synthetases class II-domain-containing protein [Rostrohypoxylon terebratum]|nr:tRNA synthetases class II-domain-containing protein [Rostrohypoxylon terebratum]
MARLLSIVARGSHPRCIYGALRRSPPLQCKSFFQLNHTRSTSTASTPPTPTTASTPLKLPKGVPRDEDLESLKNCSSESQLISFLDEKRDYFLGDSWDIFQESCKILSANPAGKPMLVLGKDVILYGHIGKRKNMGANLSFCAFEEMHSRADFQIVSRWQTAQTRQHRAHQALTAIPSYCPVLVMGTLRESQQIATNPLSEAKGLIKLEIHLKYIRCLNTFPRDVSISKDTVWSPKARYMQLRFDPLLQDRLKFRSWVKRKLVQDLERLKFLEIETPILFKSTPEGAREFLVPTRKQGYAYALPQSPQQYKQTLMAGGICKYFQFAKCFRDEDHRADRQPEFTQLDLEMAFASGRDVMDIVSRLMSNLFDDLNNGWKIVEINGVRHPVRILKVDLESNKSSLRSSTSGSTVDPAEPINRWQKLGKIPMITYADAMSKYGTDKPDPRIDFPWVSPLYKIGQYGRGLPSDFKKMISSLPDPIVEGFRVRFDHGSPSESVKFIREFMDNLPQHKLKIAPGSVPGVFVYDSGKPLNGLSALGHDGVAVLDEMGEGWPECQNGDIIVMHARTEGPLYGGSTEIGRLRTALYWAAVKQGLIPENHGFKALWVHSFPLFSPIGDEVGQGGTAGICSTHHPFTAPSGAKDFEYLQTDPLRAKADHYDFVINGVEIGGGSRRIHVAEVQEFIMRNILKMTDEGIDHFSHLLDALRAGCPPHAGFAFGFDRLLTVLLELPSVRDVIAFPKNNKGEDLLVNSPSKISPEQKKTYHIFEESDKIPQDEVEV